MLATAGAFNVDAPDVAPLSFTEPSLNVLTPATVSAFPSVIAVPDAAGPVNVVPSISVSVALVAGAVMATLLMLVAVATPKAGVTNVGEVASTLFPVPVIPVVPIKEKSHDAAVVPLVRIQETRTSLPDIAVPTKFPPDELIVMLPVELLWIIKRWPSVMVEATGSVTVCVVEPVKN